MSFVSFLGLNPRAVQTGFCHMWNKGGEVWTICGGCADFQQSESRFILLM